MRLRLPGVVRAMTAMLSVTALAANGDAGISISGDHPRYWAWQGKPTLLVGGSVQDNLFQVADSEAHLDTLASVGGNYIRNTMSSRDAGNLWPFRQVSGRSAVPGGGPVAGPGVHGGGPMYDLERENDEYWDRLATLLELAQERGIIVQIELWDRFDFAREPWQHNPYNPANNVNYTPDDSGLATDYPEHPGHNRNPFFRSVPGLDDNTLLLAYQRAQVDRLLSLTLGFTNVLYTISNETSGEPAWSDYWAGYVKKRAEAAGVRVYVTEMWDAHNLGDAMHDNTFAKPELYDYVEVSQNNHQRGQRHWDSFHARWKSLEDAPRPMNNTKIYGAPGGRFGSGDDAVERFWRNLIGGAASARFHRPDSGLGISRLVRANLASVRMVEGEVTWFAMKPSPGLLADNEPNEAYVRSGPDEQYVLFFPDGGQARLLSSAGILEARWLKPDTGEWVREEELHNAGDGFDMESPGAGRWVVVLRPAGA